MITDELIASLKAIEHGDLPRILTAVNERVGGDALREAYFDLLAAGTTTGERPRFMARGAFLRTVGDPPPMLVDRLIPEKALVLLAGKPKLGKSFLAVQVAEDISEGRAVVGEYAVNRPGPVCYLGMEDGMYEIANRLLKRGHRAIHEDSPDRPFFVCTERIVLSTLEGIAILREMLSELPMPPVLIVIDTAREALGIRDWNDAAEVSEKLRPMREFAREVCSVLLVAHNRKQAGIDAGDEIAGSGAFASSVDGWISVQRGDKQPNGNRRMWIQIVGRGAMNGDAVVEMDTHNLHFRLVPDDELESEDREKAEAARQRRYEGILAALRTLPSGKGSVGQIAQKVGDEYEAVRRLVVAAVQDGVLEETGEKLPAEGRGRPTPIYRAALGELSTYPNSSIGKRGKVDKSPPAYGENQGVDL